MPGRSGRHAPHGLSRSRSNGVVLPVLLAVICVALVLGVLWAGYTFG
ncbi:hypothetical protein [Acidocella sp.]